MLAFTPLLIFGAMLMIGLIKADYAKKPAGWKFYNALAWIGGIGFIAFCVYLFVVS